MMTGANNTERQIAKGSAPPSTYRPSRGTLELDVHISRPSPANAIPKITPDQTKSAFACVNDTADDADQRREHERHGDPAGNRACNPRAGGDNDDPACTRQRSGWVEIDGRNRAIRSQDSDAEQCERDAGRARPSQAFGTLRIETDQPNGQTRVDHDVERFARHIRRDDRRCKGAAVRSAPPAIATSPAVRKSVTRVNPTLALPKSTAFNVNELSGRSNCSDAKLP